MQSFYNLLSSTYEQVLPIQMQTVDWIENILQSSPLQNGSLQKKASDFLLLENGCATGQNARELARRGYCVAGVDLNEKMVQKAAELARSRQVNVSFYRADMTDLKQIARLVVQKSTAGAVRRAVSGFDAILNLENTWSHLTAAGEMERYATSVYEALTPGGSWFVETLNYDLLMSAGELRFAPVKGTLDGETFRFLRHYEFKAPDRALFSIEYRFSEKKAELDHTYLRATPLANLLMIMKKAGFANVTFSLFPGEPPVPAAQWTLESDVSSGIQLDVYKDGKKPLHLYLVASRPLTSKSNT